MAATGIGYAWNYAVTADLPPLGASTGTLSIILGSDTYNGAPSIRDNETFNLVHEKQNETISTYSELSLTGQLEAVQASGGLGAVTSDTFVGPSAMGPTTDIKGTLTLADGTVQTTEYRVVGKERVTVPAGTYDCWIVNQVQIQTGGTTDHFTLDVAPETGTWVRARAETDYSGGQVFKWQAQLLSETTAPQGASAAFLPFHGLH